jgi:Uma2 family endonuclease
MATITRRIGPSDHGRRLPLDDFIDALFEDGWLYELARGVVVVTEVPEVSHGRIVSRLAKMLERYERDGGRAMNYRAGRNECVLRLPGMQSSRRPDQAIYFFPPPAIDDPWTRWIPDIVIEVVSAGSEVRDYNEKREEYLRAGVREYWILDQRPRILLAQKRLGDIWQDSLVPADAVYRTHLLPGLEVRPGEFLGPAEAE